VVHGDVTLVGGGDPLLATPEYVATFRHQPQVFTDLGALADALVAAGIRRIDGAVVGDESRYDTERVVAGWPPKYTAQHAVAPLSGLLVNDGFEQRTPDGPFVAVPVGTEPPVHAATVLADLLAARGVAVSGDPRSGAGVPGAQELAAIESPSVGEVLGELLRESDNTTAELMLKELGHLAGTPSTQGGAAEVAERLRSAGFDLGPAEIVDGSGLSLDDRVTCRLLVDLLQAPGTGPQLVTDLPVAGVSGTLTERFVGTPLAGVMRAKTGSLRTVMALAGEVDDGDGALSFSFVANVPDGQEIDEDAMVVAQQSLGEVLLSWPRSIDPASLGPQAAG
jgi:D-alanyl-D-alanine carboxypeptidase/D-alanyl-D-alanine-endopeptidase (penicillin-binding protein 4)